MKRHIVSIVFAAFLIAFGAEAQSPAEQLIGKWSGSSTGPCGTTNVTVTSVEANGMVRGTLDCTQRKITVTLGDKKELDRSMAARLVGSQLTIDGANSDLQFTLENGKLAGTASAGTNTTRRPLVLTKQ